MTDDETALREMLAKGSDATFLREMIGFAAERLMELGAGALTEAAPGDRNPGRLAAPSIGRDCGGASKRSYLRVNVASMSV
ncbi:hypothetical protein ACFFIC_16445 [Roseomonas vinacea]|uniref:Transposase, Mutator family n=1 Tax=Muricoccus vinaceus TaxID=424704 RepID=A0ABV6IU32_9PROT